MLLRDAQDADRSRYYDDRDADEAYCRTLLIYDYVSRQKRHAHRFIELMLSLDGTPITIEYDGETVSSPGHVIGPLRPHAIVECGPVARLYIAIGLRRVEPLRAVPAAHPDDVRMRQALLTYRASSPSGASEQLTLKWQSDWLPGFDQAPRIEARILRALRYIDVRQDPMTTRAAVAPIVGLSASRFAALFRTEMGMPLGRYVIWRRVLIALEYLKAGQTTTQAAAHAGFADAPHLCRCYRETFGSPPSLLPVGRIVQHGAGLKALTRF